MKASLIICTYMRPEALKKLLQSVKDQQFPPDEILIIDGSLDYKSKNICNGNEMKNLKYYHVNEKDRGLTRQRNFGLSKVSEEVEIVCFLDDDIVLTKSYFGNLLQTYKEFPDAIGVGGAIIADSGTWKRSQSEPSEEEFEIDGWVRKLGERNVVRKKLGLLSDKPPGFLPAFSNGFSTGFLPPTGQTYPVEFFMGGVASYKKDLFQKLQFSHYFEGYGLYEDMDFCLRASRLGNLYVNTSAEVFHYHEEEGRPNKYKYGMMVIRNGWYVWRIKNPTPHLSAKIKWNAIALLLTMIRFVNVFTTEKKKEAFFESLGRAVGWLSLIVKKPRLETHEKAL